MHHRRDEAEIVRGRARRLIRDDHGAFVRPPLPSRMSDPSSTAPASRGSAYNVGTSAALRRRSSQGPPPGSMGLCATPPHSAGRPPAFAQQPRQRDEAVTGAVLAPAGSTLDGRRPYAQVTKSEPRTRGDEPPLGLLHGVRKV